MLSDEDYHATLALDALLTGYPNLALENIDEFRDIVRKSENKLIAPVLRWETACDFEELYVLIQEISKDARFVGDYPCLDTYFVSLFTRKMAVRIDWQILCLPAARGGWLSLLRVCMMRTEMSIGPHIARDMLMAAITYNRKAIFEYVLSQIRHINGDALIDVIKLAAHHKQDDMMRMIFTYDVSARMAAVTIEYLSKYDRVALLDEFLPSTEQHRDLFLHRSLDTAAHFGHYMIVKRLLQLERASIPMVFNGVMFSASSKGHVGIVDLLLACNEFTTNQYPLQASLQTAASNGHTNVVRRLIAHNRVELDFNHPLVTAAAAGHAPIVNIFLAEPHSCTKESIDDALVLAAGTGRLEVVKLLLPYADAAANEHEAIKKAAWNGHDAVVRVLAKHCSNIPQALQAHLDEFLIND